MHRYVYIILILLTIACGPSSKLTTAESESGVLKVALPTSADFPSIAAIDHYRITVSADDMVVPITTEISASIADTVTVSAIPAGENRLITVTAFNRQDQIVREGEAVADVGKGHSTPVAIDMEVVPVVTNLINGRSRPLDRLWLDILTDPGRDFIIERVGEPTEPLFDMVANTTVIPADSYTGQRRFYPPTLSAGHHTLRVSDPATGKSSTVELWVGHQPRVSLREAGGGWTTDGGKPGGVVAGPIHTVKGN